MVLGGSFLAAVAQFIPAPTSGLAYNHLFGFLGAFLALYGGIWLLRAEDSAPKKLEAARRAVDTATAAHGEATRRLTELQSTERALVDERKRHVAERAWLSDLYTMAGALREFLESSLVEKKTLASDDQIAQMLEVVGRPLHRLMKFDGGELWTLGVYRFVAGDNGAKGVLVCAATQRAERGHEKAQHRVWAEGEGLVGHVQMTARETVVADTRDTERAGWLYFPTRVSRIEDSERYRSLAGVPILLGDKKNPPWGVVMATSDRAGRFTPLGDERDIEPLRLLAGAVALAASASYLVKMSEGIAGQTGPTDSHSKGESANP